MAITKEKKKEIVSDLGKIFKDNKSVVFTHFKHLLANDTNVIRKTLKQNSVSYTVAKKTLMKKALESAGFSGIIPELSGEIAMAYGVDLIAPAREVYAFQKKFKDQIAIVGGVFDGKYMSKDEMISIASIPTKEVLYAQFVNLINSPIQGFVMAINQIAQKRGV